MLNNRCDCNDTKFSLLHLHQCKFFCIIQVVDQTSYCLSVHLSYRNVSTASHESSQIAYFVVLNGPSGAQEGVNLSDLYGK